MGLTGDGRLTLGLPTVIVSHIAFSIPFVTLVVQARLQGFDKSFEEAAMDLGANELVTFWRVTFPMILPGVLSGALLAFTLSLDDFVITFFTTGPGSTTLPIYVYGLLRRIITPQVNALVYSLGAGGSFGCAPVAALSKPGDLIYVCHWSGVLIGALIQFPKGGRKMKNNLRKVLAVFLLASVLLAACGGGATGDDAGGAKVTASGFVCPEPQSHIEVTSQGFKSFCLD